MRAFWRFEEVLAKLTGIALSLWAVQLVASGALRVVLSSLEFFQSTVTIAGTNAILYSMQFASAAIPRNCGFAWEPGGYASILVFGLFINLVRNKMEWKANPRFWLFLICLATTQSTTGWATSAILIAWFVSRQRLWPLWLAMTVPLGIAAMAHPMMGEKMRDALEQDDRKVIQQSIENAYEYETVYTPQRFASFQISWEDFRKNPWLGFGGHDMDSWAAREHIRIVVVTGLGEILRRFGAIGIGFFLWMTWTSSRRVNFETPGAGAVLFCLILAVGFSYAQILQPLFMMFWMAGFFLLPPSTSTEPHPVVRLRQMPLVGALRGA